MDTFTELFSQIILDVALAGIALLAVYSINTMRKLTQKANLETKRIEDEEQRKLLFDAITDVEILTEKTVTDIEQRTAQALRKAVKDGLKDKSELEALAQTAFNEIAEALKPESRRLIEKHFGNFSKYLTKAIETKVFQVKNRL